MGTYIDYWHLTGDSSYNKVVMEGMLHQVGANEDYQPDNHTASLGNENITTIEQEMTIKALSRRGSTDYT